MMGFQLSTYNPEKEYSGFYFFILNKGLNSGKPLKTPCPNCFVCQLANEEDQEQLFWLLFGMWQGQFFRQHLIGSVIPFIRKKELMDIIDIGVKKFTSNPDKVKKNISAVISIEENLVNISKRMVELLHLSGH